MREWKITRMLSWTHLSNQRKFSSTITFFQFEQNLRFICLLSVENQIKTRKKLKILVLVNHDRYNIYKFKKTLRNGESFPNLFLKCQGIERKWAQNEYRKEFKSKWVLFKSGMMTFQLVSTKYLPLIFFKFVLYGNDGICFKATIMSGTRD